MLFTTKLLNSIHLLVVPPIRLSTVAKRTFSVVRPQIWNNLPANVTSAAYIPPATEISFQSHFPDISWILTKHPGF